MCNIFIAFYTKRYYYFYLRNLTQVLTFSRIIQHTRLLQNQNFQKVNLGKSNTHLNSTYPLSEPAHFLQNYLCKITNHVTENKWREGKDGTGQSRERDRGERGESALPTGPVSPLDRSTGNSVLPSMEQQPQKTSVCSCVGMSAKTKGLCVWSSFNNSTLTKNCFWVAQFITSFHFHPFYSAIGPSVHHAKVTTGEPNKQLQNCYKPICK